MLRKPPSRAGALAGLLVVFGLGLVAGLILGAPGEITSVLSAQESAERVRLSRGSSGSIEHSPFAEIAARAAPAVVFVEVKRETSAPGPHEFNMQGPFDEMFRRLFPQTPEGGGEEMVIPSWGSGFFIEESGYVMTNNHVVRDADQVRVKATDDRFYDAEVVGEDPATDVAVIRVKEGGGFPVLPLGDSDEVRVGDWAIAVGNPFGTLTGSVTVGVISAKGRSDLRIMGGTPSYQDFIQTDASINYGNSGGPLLNSRGEVIGMNAAINPSGQGIGFAIPINLAREIAEKLINEGRVVRGYIGIYPQELTPDLAEGQGLDDREGILVSQVVEGTPAAGAGLETGDLIVRFDGEEVADVDKFRLLVASLPVGESVKIDFLRRGRERQTALTIAERPEEPEVAASHPRREVWLGIEAEEVSGRMAERLGLERGEHVVVVSRIVSGSPAEDAGLRPGDVIREINKDPVRDIADYREIIAGLRDRDKPIVFFIERDGITQFRAVRPRR